MFIELGLSLGQRIALAREEKKISQTMLAEIMGLDQSTVSKWEKNKQKPSHSKLIHLSKVFDKSLSYFLDNDNDNIKEHVEDVKVINQNELKLRMIANIRDGDLTYQIDKDNKIIYDIVSTFQLNGMADRMTKEEIESSFFIFENTEQFEDFKPFDKFIVKQTKEEIKNALYVIYDSRLKLIRNDDNFDFKKNRKKIVGLVIKMTRNFDYIEREQLINL